MSFKLPGLYRGFVSDINDPLSQLRLRAYIPQQLGKTTQTGWALPCLDPYALQTVAGSQATPQNVLPAVGSTVWIMFEGGDINYPVWMGRWVSPGQTGFLSPPPVIPPYVTNSFGLGTSATSGVRTGIVRPDATILAFDTTTPVTQVFGDAAATGAAVMAARRDHKHGMPSNPLPDTGWINLSTLGYQNGWVAGTPPAQYRQYGQWVQVRGQIKSGSFFTTIVTLPSSVRPTAQQFFTTLSAGTNAYTSVDTTGVLFAGQIGTGGSVTDFRLDGVSYLLG